MEIRICKEGRTTLSNEHPDKLILESSSGIYLDGNVGDLEIAYLKPTRERESYGGCCNCHNF